MKQDFQKYKLSLKRYLSMKNIDISQNPTYCISPNHNNSKTPAMQIHEDGFNCLSCGIHGDIYDAAGLICNILDIKNQFIEVEKTLVGFVREEPVKKQSINLDPDCIKVFENYIRNYKDREKKVKHFLKTRGYPLDIIEKMCNKFGYWPGIDEVKKEIPLDKLFKAGIPIPTAEKKYSSWFYSGVVIRLGSGYKLMWYGKDSNDNYGCQKRNSLSAKTFPCPPQKEELTGTVILTEAELSALSMISVGFKNVFSTGGTNGITKNNVDKLLKTKKIIFAFDGDNKGLFYSGLEKHLVDKKTDKIIKGTSIVKKLLNAGYSGEIHAVRLLRFNDPDDFLQDGRIEELQDLLKNSISVINVPPPEGEKDKKKTNLPFLFLGYDEKSYFVLPKFQQVPLKISRGETSIKNWLFELVKEEWWFNKFNIEVQTNSGEVKTVFDNKEAIGWFRESSYKAGIFDEKRIKGVGAHIDNSQIILNTGKNIKICGNGTIDYDEWQGENFFIKSKRNFKLSNKMWDVLEGRNLWNQINTFTFDKKMDKIAIAGFMVMSPFASILFRRPSIWIIAQKGIGKSYLIENLLSPAVGGDSYAFLSEGLSSEAFIRQSLKKDSVPIIIDEFEAKNKMEQLNITKVLNLMRSAYGGKTIGKGSATHDPIIFNINSMFCFGSININMNNEADRSRVHVCRMRESVGICKAPKNFTGLRMRTFNSLPKIMDDIEKCKEKILKIGLNDRIADTYSPLLIGTWNLVSNNEFMSGDDSKIIDFFSKAIVELTGKESVDDEDRIIERILQERIRIDTANEKTIAEMLIAHEFVNHIKMLKFSSELQRYGLKRFKMQDGKEALAIAHNSPDISRFLENTAFSEYKEIIQRNRFVIQKSHPVKMAGKQERSIILEWKKFDEMYLNDNEDENLPDFKE